VTVLQELAALYGRRAQEAGWPRPGFSTEKIGAVAVLREDGTLDELRPLMAPTGKGGKLEPRRMAVTEPVKRTSDVRPNLLWDKTAYALGVAAMPDGPGQGKRTSQEHDAFRAAHLELLTEATHPALVALRRFCEIWDPAGYAALPHAEALIDQNVVFRTGDGPFVHDLPEARALLAREGAGDALCLVTGARGPVARLHPTIKGVMGAQSSGASLVSFNNDAETSHGKSQGDNAPVSEAAAFAYGTALNALLARGSGSNLRVGGDTVAFWASGAGERQAEDAFAAIFATRKDADPKAENELAARLTALAQGKARDDDPLDPSTRLFVLGLAPNAARLAVRYWLPGTVGDLARAARDFWTECAVEPSPFARGGVPIPPKPWALLYDLAAQRDEKNIPPKLGGELMRAILTRAPYPATLLAAAIARLRVEGEPDRARHGNVDGRRAALVRAVLIRNHQMEVPMALDETADDPAYLLGRLFAAYAYAERSYQDRGASLRSKYMGAASATPARVFPVLMRGYEHNLASLRKAGGRKAGAGVKADREVSAIIAGLDGGGDLPAALPLEEQGRFFIGFYHQNAAFYTKAEDAADAEADALIEEDATE
jgi:CRISPR-associated protein Csd1